MATSETSGASEPPSRPYLRVAREEAGLQLRRQIDRGQDLLTREIKDLVELQDTREAYNDWGDNNVDLLRALFTTDEYAIGFKRNERGIPFGITPLPEGIEEFHHDLRHYINKLQSVQDRLYLIPEDPGLSHSITASNQSPIRPSNDVFVVHGHDELVKQTVARFLEKLDLKTILLHEQATQGKTIIEKFESFSGVRFAVILLTPDDVGTTKAAFAEGKRPNDRARQNVIFEHGFFVGKLGRGCVCALVKGDVEVPSDLDGVLYLNFRRNQAADAT